MSHIPRLERPVAKISNTIKRRYESLYAKMMHVLTTSQSPPLIEVVQSVLKADVSLPPHQQARIIPASPTSTGTSSTGSQQRKGGHPQAGLVFGSQASQLLNDLGFPGLAECGSFAGVARQKKVKQAALACAVVESIIRL